MTFLGLSSLDLKTIGKKFKACGNKFRVKFSNNPNNSVMALLVLYCQGNQAWKLFYVFHFFKKERVSEEKPPPP